MARESHFNKCKWTYVLCIIIFSMMIISSCTPVTDVPADRTKTVIDSISIDSLYRRTISFDVTSLAFETEYPSKQIVKNIVLTNTSDTLTIPKMSMTLKLGNQGFSLLSDTIEFTLPHMGFQGNSKSIPIRFDALHEGIFRDTILINGWKSVYIPLTAIVYSGTVVWIEDLDFGSLPLGENRDTIVNVYNYGNSPAIISDLQKVDGDIDQYELFPTTPFPMTILPGKNVGIPIRMKSNAQGLNVNMRLKANISYAGNGRVKTEALCTANVFVPSGVYVTDISVHHINAGSVYTAICTIVNNSTTPCIVAPRLQFEDNPTCNVLLVGTLNGFQLDNSKATMYIMNITPKRKGAFSIDVPFTITGNTVTDTVCRINGTAF